MPRNISKIIINNVYDKMLQKNLKKTQIPNNRQMSIQTTVVP